MAMQSYLQFFPLLFILFFLFYYLFLSKKHHQKHTPTNWPLLGMLPAALRNAHRLHDFGTEVLTENNGTIFFKGPWLANVNMVLTCDPANIQHILSDKFSNYGQGPDFVKMFDMVGSGIFNSDEELWEIHRKVYLSILHHPRFKTCSQETAVKKLEKSMIPMLNHFADEKIKIDLQDIVDRFMFDVFSELLLGHDPGSLSPGLPDLPCQQGFVDVERGILQRHYLPEIFWKLQKWLNFGKERNMRMAMEAIDNYIYLCIDKNIYTAASVDDPDEFNNKTAFLEAYKAFAGNPVLPPMSKVFLRDVYFGLLAAGKDTISTALSWFFFLVAKNPRVEAMIVEEMRRETGKKEQEWAQVVGHMEEHSPKLVYLHGAISEALRLFPPVALHHKAPVKPDVLPSGVSVTSNTKILMFFYSMGRMESIWGEDCLEFKPERWITEKGTVKHQPASKFVVFSTGQRSCVGKTITFSIMKMVIVAILCNYRVTLVDERCIPEDAIVIHIKHGLMVMLSKKS